MTPTNLILYNKIKKKIFDKNPINSAYRSGLLIKTYKNEFLKKYGDTEPFKNNFLKRPLERWFKEHWINTNEIIGLNGYPVYRPTIRVTKDTPKTVQEISPEKLYQQYLLKQKYKYNKNLPKF
jgi:hypothetical protein